MGTNSWFVTGDMVILAGLACIALIPVDVHLTPEFQRALRWLRMGGTRGLRTFLATLTGSIVTVLALVFSITTAVLTMALIFLAAGPD